MKKILTALAILSTFITSAAAAEIPSYDPIDSVKIVQADTYGVSFTAYGVPSMYSRLFIAKYDEEGRLESVDSTGINIDNQIGQTYTVNYDKVELESAVIGAKVMMWSTYSSGMRPASMTAIIEERDAMVTDYGTADNNPTMIVKEVITETSEDGSEYYTVVGILNGEEVRHTTGTNTIVAKITGPFYGNREYNAEVLWSAYGTNKAEFTDVISAGDIVGVDGNGEVFMVMVDSQELVSGVMYNSLPELYNLYNIGVSSARDSLVTGPLSWVEYNDEHCFIEVAEKTMHVDADMKINIVTVSEDGGISVSEETATPIDMVPYDDATKTGDFVFARYAVNAILQEMYIYRFE